MLSKITIALFITCLIGPVINVFLFGSVIIDVINLKTALMISNPITKWAAIIAGFALLSLILEIVMSAIKLHQLNHKV